MLADEDASREEVRYHRVGVTAAAHFEVEVRHVLTFDRLEVRAVEFQNFLASFRLGQAVDSVLGYVLRGHTLEGVVTMLVSEVLDTALIVFNRLETAVGLP